MQQLLQIVTRRSSTHQWLGIHAAIIGLQLSLLIVGSSRPYITVLGYGQLETRVTASVRILLIITASSLMDSLTRSLHLVGIHQVLGWTVSTGSRITGLCHIDTKRIVVALYHIIRWIGRRNLGTIDTATEDDFTLLVCILVIIG